MNFELFVTKKIIKGSQQTFSKPIIRISIVAIALGIMMMSISLSIVNGFQTEIERKISGINAPITITNYKSRHFLEQTPIDRNREFTNEILDIDGVKHVQVYANKGLILKTKEDNYGAIAKGIDSDFDWSFFKEHLIQGELPFLRDDSTSNDILISSHIANKLTLKKGDNLYLFFAQQPPRYRKVYVSGIYQTGLGELDERLVLIDLRHIQKVNEWEDNLVGGFEIILNPEADIPTIDDQVYKVIDNDLISTSILESRPDIFNWLELQDVNVIIIISLLIAVCGIDIISALLILILERTNMIGILKALGANNLSIRKIFIYNAIYLVLQGIIWGNLLGLGFAFLQKKFKFLKLPQEAYFIDNVPIEFDWIELLLLNAGTILCCLSMLIIPSNLIARISPSKAIRFQ
ncbi:MAG: ABC transporter permease [Verrucomicrobia bacterium]|nr:ABC transporter permease [Verrucomicrobiota bacterium]